MAFNRQEQYTWDWLYKRWEPISYRAKKVIEKVMAERRPSQWFAEGSGTDLQFSRAIEINTGEWPFDREVVVVRFDARGRLNACQREKHIVVDRGRSYADLCRMLRIDEVK